MEHFVSHTECWVVEGRTPGAVIYLISCVGIDNETMQIDRYTQTFCKTISVNHRPAVGAHLV